MPMFNANILPDVTGRALGAPDKQWDAYVRNIIISGSMSGAGLAQSNVHNPTPDVDTVNMQSGLDANSYFLRFRITNPSTGPVLIQFKNGLFQLGGVNGADSPSVPLSMYSNPADAANLLNVYQRGSLANLAMAIDNLGRISSYAPGYAATYAYQVIALGDANPLFSIGPDGFLRWGAGGANAWDVALTRTAANAMALRDAAAGWSNLALGQLTSNVATGTAPFVVASTTLVANLNADKLDGSDWASPPTIGGTTPGDIHAALLSASAQIQSSLNDGVTPPLSVASIIPVDVMRVKFASDVTIESSMLNNGSGFKHKRVNIASLAAGAEVNVTVTWTTAFADSGYTPTVSVFDSGTAGGVQAGLRIKRITQQDAAHIAVQVINDDTVAHVGVLLAHAIRG